MAAAASSNGAPTGIVTFKMDGDAAGSAFLAPATGGPSTAAAYSHSCALSTAGGVKCWGDNQFGQIGAGVGAGGSATPVDVAGLSGSVVSVVGGIVHSCALTGAGGVKCWGDNFFGQLGNGQQSPAARRSTSLDLAVVSSPSGRGAPTPAR